MARQLKLGAQQCANTVIDGSWKGMPGGIVPFPLKNIQDKGLNLLRQDVPLPACVMKRSAMVHNSEAFFAFLARHNLSFAPHGKTYMAPQIFQDQISKGAWAITVATSHQVKVCREAGFNRLLMANQLTGKANVRTVVEELEADPAFNFYCIVDSPECVALLDANVRAAGLTSRRMNVLLEVGYPGGRTGARNKAQVAATLDSIKASPVLALAGVEGYEGMIPGSGAEGGREDRVTEYMELVRHTLCSICPEDIRGTEGEVVITAGGTHYFDIVAQVLKDVDYGRPVRTVIRSGNYLPFDSGVYRACQQDGWAQRGIYQEPLLKPALEVWAYVQTYVPEEGLAILTMGKRDAGYDAGWPIPLRRFRPSESVPGEGEWIEIEGVCKIDAMNDQHAYMRFSEQVDLKVGDMVCVGLSHCCTTIDKWKMVPIVDDDYNYKDGFLTFF